MIAATAELCSAWTGEGARPHTSNLSLSGHTTNWTAGAFGLRLFWSDALRNQRGVHRFAQVSWNVRNSLHIPQYIFEDALISA